MKRKPRLLVEMALRDGRPVAVFADRDDANRFEQELLSLTREQRSALYKLVYALKKGGRHMSTRKRKLTKKEIGDRFVAVYPAMDTDEAMRLVDVLVKLQPKRRVA